MSTILKILTSELESDLKRRINQRVEAMLRDINYLRESSDQRLASLIRVGWSIGRLQVLCELNSFYQIVLGPLASSARSRRGALGPDVTIVYGNLLRFDPKRAKKLQLAHRDFMTTVSACEVEWSVLTANHASDIVFLMHRDCCGE